MLKTKSEIIVPSKYSQQCISFIRFLQQIGRKHSLRITYRSVAPGHVKLSFDGPFESYFQELLLNKALYYYSCTISPRRELIEKVLFPIIFQTIEGRYKRPNLRLLKKHIYGKTLEPYFAADFKEYSSHKYELLINQWQTKIIKDYDFIVSLDSLLTEYMLLNLKFQPGEKTPSFGTLVKKSFNENIIRDDDSKKAFLEIHKLRTRGLHRLERQPDKDLLARLASTMYWYFSDVDEKHESHIFKTIKLNGKRYRRIRYGNEKPLPHQPDQTNWVKIFAQTRPCGDCLAIKGELHLESCDMEQCPRCLGQALGCDCILDE